MLISILYNGINKNVRLKKLMKRNEFLINNIYYHTLLLDFFRFPALSYVIRIKSSSVQFSLLLTHHSIHSL
jgi:hypothetical protein